jgi:ribonuclease HII
MKRPWLIARAAALPDLPELLIGVDEAGRGPLAGPVTAAAVLLDPSRPIAGLVDSKKLTVQRRAALAEHIRERALGFAIVHVEAAEIDRINILQATFSAMRACVAQLQRSDVPVWIDGNQIPAGIGQTCCAVIGGDARVAAISAASILAKTARDQRMLQLHQHYPQYRFDLHAGYPVPLHLSALREHGPCAEHRRSYKPVAALLTPALDLRRG